MKVIILAGGSGARLWPLSRNECPKQFIKLQEDKPSLFQDTFDRSLLLADIEDIYIVTNEKHKELAINDIKELGYDYNEANILVEPEAKNTLPAIYAGVHEIAKKGNDYIVVFPSDHRITKSKEFIEILKASEALAKDSIITFGIKPDGPNTGYGYIEPAEEKKNGYSVKEFKEKPDYKTAVEYIQKGYFWNAGIFMFNTEVFTNEVKVYSEEIYTAFIGAHSIREAFAKISKKVSIDYGIMEKSSKVAVVPVDIGWDDLGSFDSLYDVFDKDSNNNIINGENIVIGSTNNYVHINKEKIVAIVGIEDLIVIDTDDALLICKREQSQKVKEVVDHLKAQKDIRVEKHIKD